MAMAEGQPGLMKLIRKNDLRVYILLSVAIAWALSAPVLISAWGFMSPGMNADSGTGQVLLLLSELIPGLLAVLFIAVAGGWEGLGNMVKSGFRWKFGLEWYLLAIFLPLAFVFTIDILYGLIGHKVTITFDSSFFTLNVYLIAILALAILIVIAGFGYVLPRLLKYYSPFIAGLILGLLISLVFLPPYLANYKSLTAMDMLMLVAGNFAIVFLLIWVFKMAGYSLLPLIILEFSYNFWGYGHGTWLIMFVALYLLVAGLIVLSNRSYFGSRVDDQAEGGLRSARV